jgi:putative membrane protein
VTRLGALDARRAARAAVMGCWTALLAWLWFSGEVSRYLGPRTLWVVPFGAVALGAAGLAHLVAPRSPVPARRITLAEAGGLALLLVPVLVVIVVPRPSLGALAASRKSTSEGTLALGSLAAPAPERGGRISFVEIHFAGESEQYAQGAGITDGTKVSLLGFVTHGDAEPEGDFELTRFYVSCCAADALPYSVAVDPGDAPDPGDDVWLRVSGSLVRRDDRYVLVAERMRRRAEPKDPYLY